MSLIVPMTGILRGAPSAVPRILVALAVTVAVAVVLLGSVVLKQSHDDAWKAAKRASANLATALERDIGRNVAVLDLSMQGAIDALREPGIDEVSAGIRQSAIFDRALMAEHLGSMLVMDAGGKIIASSMPVPDGLDLTDRDYFRVHRETADTGLFVSHAFRSRVRGGTPSIALSRRITGPDGSFQGIVRAALETAFFEHLFANLELGREGTVTVFRSDAQMIARHPATEGDFGRDMTWSATFRHIASSPRGSYVGIGSDGLERLYSFRRVGDLPLIISVGLSTKEVFAGWREKSFIIAGLLVFLSGSVLALCVCFRREIMRRQRIERCLEDTAVELRTLAATDGLTGLSNRRAFDLEYARARRQSQRSGKPMAVLMLDADCFKAYNDTYGHAAGDDVLVSIARCIASNVRRPLDCAARYGGEEFVVLLPETDIHGALRVAERIRGDVEALGHANTGSPSGFVTVSIGVAEGVSVSELGAGCLVRRADIQLYEAKRSGRNRAVGEDVRPGIADLNALSSRELEAA